MWWIYFVPLVNIFVTVVTQETDNCKCVEYYHCDNVTNTIITDGGGIIEFGERFGGKSCTDCKCTSLTHVCCALKQPPIKTTRSSIKCGIRSPDGVGFKNTEEANEEQVLFGEFPWAVDILVGDVYHCGGSLIHPSVVLTAAHCVARKKTYLVRAGDWDNSNTQEVFDHQDIRVKTVKIHEEYNPAVLYNDIALLFLNGSFALADHIQIGCLASSVDYNAKKCFVIGRGKDDAGKYKAIMKKVELPLVEKSQCQGSLRQTKLKQRFNLHKSFICSGGKNGKDACTGDGGGPLLCSTEDEERYEQVGIVSWGLGCHNDDVPGVYTNVPFFKEWIDKQLKENGVD